MNEFEENELANEEIELFEELQEVESTEQAEQDEIEENEELEEELLDEQIEEQEEVEEFEYVTRAKPLGRLVTLVAFTAMMLVTSTYAWFSAQKNVTIGGLEGIVKVAEGLEISLDAQNWSQEIDFSKYTSEQLKKQYGVKADGTITGHTFTNNDLDNVNDVEHNIIPDELLPVSTTGTTTNGIGLSDMNMYRGIVNTQSNISSLSDVITVLKGTTGNTTRPITAGATEVLKSFHHDYPGYYAIDLFLKNSTRTTEAGTANYSEILQLNTNSQLLLKAGGSTSTGLQNTVRVAFAVYNSTGTVAPDTVGGTNNEGGDGVTDQDWIAYVNDANTTATNYMSAKTVSQILNAFKGQTIKDVAIWEPNASDHVDYIYNNVEQYKNTTNGGKYPKFSLADSKLFMNNDLTSGVTGMTYTTGVSPVVNNNVGAMRTYALTSSAVTATTVADIYDWDETLNAGLGAQVTLQTEKTSESDFKISGGVKNLVSVTAPTTAKYTAGNETLVGPQTPETASTVAAFQTENKNLRMQDGAIAKVRMYVWLEGQDVDTINHASHGGGIHLDVGLLKDAEVGDEGEEPDDVVIGGPYMPTGFTKVSDATATTGYTIKDGSGNQYVWVEVPRTAAIYDEIGTDLDLDSMNETELAEACGDIETELQEYATDYRETGYSDTWESQETQGIASETEYNNLKNTMLKSIYQNGGFYIGKYETGTTTIRTSPSDELTTPVIQANALPYMYVTNAQAQSLASGMVSGDRTSSLMFGIQWDLVLKYLEETNSATQAQLKGGDGIGSTNWGNYINSEYTITNENALCAIIDPDTETFNIGTIPYSKASEEMTLLTPGADSSFEKMGIYDLAGNVFEWTLEQYTSNSNSPCTIRGGCYGNDGSSVPASDRSSVNAPHSVPHVGFRSSLF